MQCPAIVFVDAMPMPYYLVRQLELAYVKDSKTILLEIPPPEWHVWIPGYEVIEDLKKHTIKAALDGYAYPVQELR
jgi:hypothetical protein